VRTRQELRERQHVEEFVFAEPAPPLDDHATGEGQDAAKAGKPYLEKAHEKRGSTDRNDGGRCGGLAHRRDDRRCAPPSVAGRRCSRRGLARVLAPARPPLATSAAATGS